MNRKNIVALFLIVCIVFINIEIKVQAEVIDGKIDWESATILTIYDEKIFFSIKLKLCSFNHLTTLRPERLPGAVYTLIIISSTLK